MDAIKAWHFSQDRRLAYGDGREIVVGQTLSVDGPIKLCEHGLHGLRNVFDAMTYAPGAILCAVEIWGDVIEGKDKIVGRHRKTLAMADVTDTLLLFAREVAKSVVHLWDCPPVVLRFLESGEGADEAGCVTDNTEWALDTSAAWAAVSATAWASRAARAAAARAARTQRAEMALALAAVAARAQLAAEAAAWAASSARAAALAEAALEASLSDEDAEAVRRASERKAAAMHNEMLLDLLRSRHPELFLGEITQ